MGKTNATAQLLNFFTIGKSQLFITKKAHGANLQL
jgi:hypothetical protein